MIYQKIILSDLGYNDVFQWRSQTLLVYNSVNFMFLPINVFASVIVVLVIFYWIFYAMGLFHLTIALFLRKKFQKLVPI